ncbi:MAG: hypothetical protein ACE5FT_00125 [Candidatus Nanoarchaeia archaeon]
MRKLLMVLIAGILLLGCVQVLRGISFVPLGAESYAHMHASTLAISGQDPLVMGANWVWQQPVDFVMQYFSLHGLFALGIICALLSVVLVWMLLHELGIDKNIQWLATGLWTLSPLFLHMAYVGNGVGLVVVLQLFAFWLVAQKDWRWSIPAAGLFLIASVHSLWQFVIVALGLLILAFNEEYRGRAIGLVFGVACGATVLHLNHLVMWWHLPALNFVEHGSWIADLGGKGGIGIFLVVLGVFGFLQKNYRRWLVFLFIFVGLAMIERSLLHYVLLVLAYGGGIALHLLLTRKWAIKELQWITILLLACGIIFSPLAYARELSDMQPMPELFEAMEELGKRTSGDSIILTTPENGAYIQGIAGRKVVLPLVYYGEDAIARLNMTQTVWRSYNLPEASALIRAWNITHVFVSPDMVSGGVWDEPNKAFHYLLRDSETFIKVHDEDGYSLWEVRKL